MKNNIKKITVLLFFALVPIFNLFAQPLPGTNSDILAGGTQLNCTSTPVGSGYWILLALAFSYGVYKIWQMRKAETPA
jgi:hypothetical protein